jgi:hypothetical protein
MLCIELVTYNTVKPFHTVNSIKQSLILKCHRFISNFQLQRILIRVYFPIHYINQPILLRGVILYSYFERNSKS